MRCQEHVSISAWSAVYFISAKPSTEETINRKKLKVTGEPALQPSLVQQPTPHLQSLILSSSLSQRFSAVSQTALLAQSFPTAFASSFLDQVLMHLSSMKGHSFKQVPLLLSSLLLLQVSSLPEHTQHFKAQPDDRKQDNSF